MKTYLGDGVYADTDGVQITLTAENGYSITNVIYLEREVLKALILFAKKQGFGPNLPQNGAGEGNRTPDQQLGKG